MNPSTDPFTLVPARAESWVNINLRLNPYLTCRPHLTRQAAITEALRLSNFTTLLHAHGWHIADYTIE